MSLKVIGAGLGRTGTMSLKLALEQLLGGPCYHMTELFQHLEAHTPLWHAAARGEAVDWDQVFSGYIAAVDEPVSMLWKPITEYYPDAVVVLSARDAESWWKSARETILEVKINPDPNATPERKAWLNMVLEVYRHVYPEGFSDKDKAIAAYQAHNKRVMAGVPVDRLLVWQVSDGWEPLCRVLDQPVPDTPFPVSNTTEDFKARRAGQQKKS